MKKIILLLTILLSITSCENATLENSIKDNKKFTTIAIQEMPKDTVVISIENNNIYVFDSVGLVEYRAVVTNSNTVDITLGGWFFSMLVAFLIGMFILAIKFS